MIVIIILDIDNIGPSFSGAPVFDYTGKILGIIVGGIKQNKSGIAISIETMIKCLSDYEHITCKL